MARIRTVKPEFWADEKVSTMPRDARLLFLGLFNFADDAGRMRGSPLLIRAQVFPYDTDIDSDSLLRILAERSLIVRYEVAGESYIWIRNFNKHQKIDKPSESVLPTPPARGNSAKAPRRLAEASTTEGKGKEGNGSGKGSGNGQGMETLPASVAALPIAAVGKTVPTRLAYESAFRERWGSEPLTSRVEDGKTVTDRTANGQLKKFVELVGAKDSPAVAEFYVKHAHALYVNAKHPINLLLRDAQKLHNEWTNNAPMTGAQARQIERTETNLAGWTGMLKEKPA